MFSAAQVTLHCYTACGGDCCCCLWKFGVCFKNRFGFHFRLFVTTCRRNRAEHKPCMHAQKGLTQTLTHTIYRYSRPHTCTHTNTVFPSSTLTVCVTDLISPTICWLEALRRRSYPAWQIQTASVCACFSQGLTQYGRVESPAWPPNLHAHIPTSKDSATGLGGEDCSFLGFGSGLDKLHHGFH